MTISRRGFLGEVAGFALATLRLDAPDVVLYNGHIITVDRARPVAQAVAIGADRLIAVGSTAEIRALARRGTKQVDLAGRTVVPGFIDAHTHPAYAGRRHLRYVDCDLRSIAAIRAPSRSGLAACRRAPGSWG